MANTPIGIPGKRRLRGWIYHGHRNGNLPPGLDEDVIRYISAKKNEPEWLHEWRLKAYHAWRQMTEPTWAHVHYPRIDPEEMSYYSAPKSIKDGPNTLDDVDPELLIL